MPSSQASPLVSAKLIEILVSRQPASTYTHYLAIFATLYVSEPILTRIYIRSAVTAGERVRAELSMCSVHLPHPAFL